MCIGITWETCSVRRFTGFLPRVFDPLGILSGLGYSTLKVQPSDPDRGGLQDHSLGKTLIVRNDKTGVRFVYYWKKYMEVHILFRIFS